VNILRDRVAGESFDYNFLMDCLSDYKSPRSKVTHLLRAGDLVRVKKGLYVFGSRWRRSMICPEALANQIYGPSYVSREYALAFYGLIPEHVIEVTSMTSKRQKNYETSIGRFSYLPLPVPLFSVGYTIMPMTNSTSALIATPEKALADLLYVRKMQIQTATELEELLFDDLRLDETGIKKLRIGVFTEILRQGGSPLLTLLIEWLRRNK
jgi:hypothetical protein